MANKQDKASPEYMLRQWWRSTASSTNTKVILARYECQKLLLALSDRLPPGFTADSVKITQEPDEPDTPIQTETSTQVTELKPPTF